MGNYNNSFNQNQNMFLYLEEANILVKCKGRTVRSTPSKLVDLPVCVQCGTFVQILIVFGVDITLSAHLPS